jgi:chromosome segregation ATPase
MRFHRLFALLLASFLVSCAQTSSDLTTVARSSQVTLNAENDVYGLTVRYHEAMDRAASYRPLVDAEETRLRELREALRSLRADTTKLAVDLDKLNAEKSELTQTKETLEVELVAKRAEISALQTEKSKTDEEHAQITQESGSHQTALDALIARKKEEEVLLAQAAEALRKATEHRTTLESQVAESEASRAALQTRYDAIRARTESLRPSVLSTEILLLELERRLAAADTEATNKK